MKEIKILLTRYSDTISNIIYYLTSRGYTHASIALEDEPDKFYSFNYKGFAIETLEKHKKRGVQKSRCYTISIPDDAYYFIRGKIDYFIKTKEIWRYSSFGAFCCVLHIPFHLKNHYFCSQFVAELLKQSGAVRFKRPACLFLPNHFIGLMRQQGGCRLAENVI